MQLSKDGVKALLKESKDVKIKFLKVNGDVREMIATTNEEIAIFPATEPPATQRRREKTGAVHIVWDTELKEFRSFRWENLREVNGVSCPSGL